MKYFYKNTVTKRWGPCLGYHIENHGFKMSKKKNPFKRNDKFIIFENMK